jgi:hypothetical protein
MASGQIVRGRQAWEALFHRTQAATPGSAGLRAEVVSTRHLTRDVAIANLTLHDADQPTHVLSWPRHTAILLVYHRGGWSVAASRAGGNYSTRDRGWSAARALIAYVGNSHTLPAVQTLTVYSAPWASSRASTRRSAGPFCDTSCAAAGGTRRRTPS